MLKIRRKQSKTTKLSEKSNQTKTYSQRKIFTMLEFSETVTRKLLSKTVILHYTGCISL